MRVLKASAVAGLCFLQITALLLFLPGIPFAAPPAGRVVSQYRPLFKPFYDEEGRIKAAVRAFAQAGKEQFLCLDPYSFSFHQIPAEALVERTATEADWLRTPFGQALRRYTTGPCKLQNQGIIRAEEPREGYFLTIDLCPSARPLDRDLFKAIASLAQPHPIPVTVMISGRWLKDHREDLGWLKGLSSAGRLAITWGNHSLTHPYRPGMSLEQNFLLTPGTDFEKEVLGLEQLLLEEGLPPSPFFRFPGLVTDQGLLERLRLLNAVPVGSDAWLAKGETPKPGSIILVHGNGNEPSGIKRLKKLFKELASPQGRRAGIFLPISSAFSSRP